MAKGSMEVTRGQPTSSAVQLVAGNNERASVTLQNVGTVPVYVGQSSAVVTTTGLKLDPDDILEDNESVGAWWGITASGTADVRVCQITKTYSERP